MMAGQTINDRLLAARHSIAGQGLAKSVCKATTEEMIAPKKKHLDYLVHCTNEPNVSIPQLANLLVERTQNANWVVVYNNSTFQLSNFLDKSGVQGYDMSPYIRRYAKYLNDKALSYRTVAFDFCKVKRGLCRCCRRSWTRCWSSTAPPTTSPTVLFACYNDGIINLLEKYFDMNKKNCREALDLYKKFLIRMDRVGEFLKGDIPDLTKAPSSLLDALEAHLAIRTWPIRWVQLFQGDEMTGEEDVTHISELFNKVQSPTSAANNPFLSAPSQPPIVAHQNIVDLFGTPPADLTSTTKASDDLLSLGNPFADMFGAAPASNGNAMWQPQSNGAGSNTFVSEANFTNVFSNTDAAGQQHQVPQQTGKVLTGDLDSSLAQLANNLSINKTATAQKPMQWSSPKNGKPSAGWTPQPMQATTGAGYRPMTSNPAAAHQPLHLNLSSIVYCTEC
ncbi:unnamed protein product [Leptidea sinapis]|uniref:ENTH domain-containing protein n=1 Tax=Leptidea sinapis TaxID=189913 RepID=A0A5E4QNS1_9NEOP|nr:unnamed protein product [Leptidea sinapis]